MKVTHGERRTVRAFLSDRDARDRAAVINRLPSHLAPAAEREARRILAETETVADGWHEHVNVLYPAWKRTRALDFRQIAGRALAEALAAFVAEAEEEK